MLFVVQKCKKCKGPILESFLNDRDENNFTQFHIVYCPNCVKLGDEIPAIVWGHMVKQKSKKPTSKIRVSRSKLKKVKR